MKTNLNYFSSLSNINNNNCFPNNLNSSQNAVFSYNISKFKPFNFKKSNIIKKRTYNELMENYKEKFNVLFKKENEDLYKTINKNFQTNRSKLNTKYENDFKSENMILSNKNKEYNNKEITIQRKKFIMDDDIDDVEKDFMIKKKKKTQKKYNLSKSYLYDEEPPFYSDLEDTKENSFSALNFSVDYPEISLDNSIKNKLITNAIELEKTFNRFFNIKNMPNKK